MDKAEYSKLMEAKIRELEAQITALTNQLAVQRLRYDALMIEHQITLEEHRCSLH